MKADTMNEKTIQPQDVFVELRALTEALLTRADADYLRRQVDAAIEVMAERGYSPPTPWPDEDFGVAVWGRSRAASEPGEVARLAEEAKARARNAATLPRDPEPRRMQLDACIAAIDRLASMATSPASEPGEVARLADIAKEAMNAAYHHGRAYRTVREDHAHAFANARRDELLAIIDRLVSMATSPASEALTPQQREDILVKAGAICDGGMSHDDFGLEIIDQVERHYGICAHGAGSISKS
jgi:hypothetical protein